MHQVSHAYVAIDKMKHCAILTFVFSGISRLVNSFDILEKVEQMQYILLEGKVEGSDEGEKDDSHGQQTSPTTQQCRSIVVALWPWIVTSGEEPWHSTLPIG